MQTKKIAHYLKNKTILVTGGTGSFGEYLVRALIPLSPKKIIIFSRDEWKQFNLKNELRESDTLLEFVIGDVRNFDSLFTGIRDVDIVYHAAAMKHVPISEENPMEAVFTNVYGAYNLKEVAVRNNVKKVIAVSTDKAVRSVNVMGMTKAIQERILLSNRGIKKTIFVVVRFGNVVGSRGSVIPLFIDQLKKKRPLTLTDERMTRFLITLKDAMELIFTATLKGQGGEIFVKKMPVCNISDLAEVMIEELTRNRKYPIKIIGMREGEQLYESLVSEEEMKRAKEDKDYFVVYPYGTKNVPQVTTKLPEFNTSLISERMSKGEIKRLLRETGWV